MGDFSEYEMLDIWLSKHTSEPLHNIMQVKSARQIFPLSNYYGLHLAHFRYERGFERTFLSKFVISI
jgi:hypothetical protein